MKLLYYNDRKGKPFSHEIDASELPCQELDYIGTGYGSTLPEALTDYYDKAVNLRNSLDEYISKIKEEIELIDGSGTPVITWTKDDYYSTRSEVFLVKDAIDKFIKSITEEEKK